MKEIKRTWDLRHLVTIWRPSLPAWASPRASQTSFPSWWWCPPRPTAPHSSGTFPLVLNKTQEESFQRNHQVNLAGWTMMHCIKQLHRLRNKEMKNLQWNKKNTIEESRCNRGHMTTKLKLSQSPAWRWVGMCSPTSKLMTQSIVSPFCT